MQNCEPKLWLWAASALLAASLSVSPASAVDDLGFFELDGNAVDDSGPGLPDDWSTLYNNGNNDGGSADPFTGIEADPAPQSIFTGGRKDI